MRCALGSAVGAAVLLGWLGSVASGVQQPPDTTVRARMEAALAHLAGGEAEAAIPLLLSVVDEVPDHGPARLQLGALAIGRREWGVAEDHLRIALAATGPDAPPGAVPAQRPGLAWALLAEALDGRGELAEALRATEEAVRLAPTFVPALLRRSDLARRLASDPDASAAWTPLRVGWAETALETARAAVDLLPERPGPWTALALAALGSQADDLAQCAARRAAGLATQDPAAWLLLARATARSDESAALEFAERALEAGGEDDPGAWMLLGELRAFRMDLEGSLAAYAEALRRDPAAAGEIASPALDALAARQDAELLALLAERADRVPGALNTRFTLAKHALREGRATEALELLRRLAALRPDHAAILAALHTALRQAGDPRCGRGAPSSGRGQGGRGRRLGEGERPGAPSPPRTRGPRARGVPGRGRRLGGAARRDRARGRRPGRFGPRRAGPGAHGAWPGPRGARGVRGLARPPAVRPPPRSKLRLPPPGPPERPTRRTVTPPAPRSLRRIAT